MTPSLRLKMRLLPILALGALIMEVTAQSKIWMVLLVVLGGAWLVSFLWARSLAKNLRLVREMRYGWAQVGDQLEERFALENTGGFPIPWVEIDDQSTLPGYLISRATLVPAEGTNTWNTEGVCSQRGVYQLGGTRLRSGDPFGIYEVTLDDHAARTLAVMPPILPLPFIHVEPGGYLGEGRPRAHALEQTVNAASVRAYQTGDSARLIHWPTTARRGKTFVRTFDGAPAGDWWIVLDLDQRAQAGAGWNSTVELGVILAASLADLGLRAHKSVGLIASGRQLAWIKPQANENQRWEILRALAVAEPGEKPLVELLEGARPALGRQASLILVTSSGDGAWVEPLARMIWRGMRPTVLLLDAQSFDPAAADVAPLATLLDQHGIPNLLIPRALLDRKEARPGQRGKWEWRLMPTGKAVAVSRPDDTAWKKVSP
jgi:uncharacterized protein (DUF58 family)